MKFPKLVITTLLMTNILYATCLFAQTQLKETGVTFAAGVTIPVAPPGLEVFRLAPQNPPTEFIRQILPTAAPDYKELQPLSETPLFRELRLGAKRQMFGAVDGKHVAVLLDPATGDLEVFPAMTSQKPVDVESRRNIESQAKQRATEIFARADIIGKDPTRTAIGNLIPVFGARLDHRPEAKANRELYMVYVPLRRFVGEFPVYGLGSRASVAFGTDGRVQGFVRRWKLAAPQGRVGNVPKPDEAKRAIIGQLSEIAKRAQITVTGVKLAYYDGNKNYMQPVYRFIARVHSAERTSSTMFTGDDSFLIGYVPIGKELEPLPVLGKAAGKSPAFPKTNTATAPPPPGDPTVGRYVVRNDDDDWVNDANEFMDGLNSGFPIFTDSQYFWAYPFEFLSDPGAFINSVNLALVEAHGNWWGFSTIGTGGEWINMSTIAAPGYGSASGGQLAYWVIHSCEVIPSPDDTPNWADPWWNIFGGLHSVVSYRTIMYIDDDVGGPYGNDVAWLAPIVGAWANEVSTADAYDDGDTSKTHRGIEEPMGRAATISVCGTENEPVIAGGAIPPANCLRIFWFPD